jgi:Ca-activated chloride channel family protein
MQVCHASWAVLRFIVFVTIFSAVVAHAQEPVPPPAKPIRVSVDRVNVGVIVTDSHGSFVSGLHREDFRVFDDGAEQPITDFAAVEEPAQVVLLVEAGPAVYFLEASHLRAAYALLDGLSAGDRVAVVKYDEAPQPILDFTADKQVAAGALEHVRFNLGFGMLNLSGSLSSVLDWLAKAPGKKTIVLLSTGVDTSPPADSAATLARLKTSDVRILAVSLAGELRGPPPNPKQKKKAPSEKSAVAEQGFAEADRLLTLITEATGGRVYFPKNAKDIASIYAEIAQLVRHEYSLAFAPPAHDRKVHAIEVRVSAVSSTATSAPVPAYRIDYRRAYLAP